MIASALELGIYCSRLPSYPAVRCQGRALGQRILADSAAVVQIDSASSGKKQGALLRPRKLGDTMTEGPFKAAKGFLHENQDGKITHGSGTRSAPLPDKCDCSMNGVTDIGAKGSDHQLISTVGRSTNIRWHECPVGKTERQKLLGQKGCIVWITGLSGSGKSTLACALSRELFQRGHVSYVLDGDNLRHGLNSDLSFCEEDRAENVRRIGEVAKLFADAGVICIASSISPYRKDRDACRASLPEGSFIEVFMDMPLELCEARDVKGLYKLARVGRIKGFTGIDDPYEPPLNCEIVIRQEEGICPSPKDMAEQVLTYMEVNGYLRA